jgi:choline-sulfatase
MRRFEILLVAVLFSVSCVRDEPKVTAYSGAPVVIISIDTLRSDRLPAYGYDRIETPALDALRDDGILYRNAWSHAPTTLPAHVSLLTGLLPAQHGVRNNLGYVFDGTKHKSLPKLLEAAGYETGAAVSAYVLRGTTGLAAEFNAYDDAIAGRADAAIGSLSRPGNVTAAIARDWIVQRKERPFFYLLHLFEPHTPYTPPEPFRSRYADPYDGEIAAADAIVGDLIDSLKQGGVYDRAIVILLSDHGEGLGDHGEAEHGVFLYREAIQVPLIIKLPHGDKGGSVVEENVQLIDLMPTIAALTGVKPPQGLSGQSITGAIPAGRGIYSETLLPRLHFGWSDLRSLVKGRYHYIEAPRAELYDLVVDPRETVNILEDQRRQYAAMREELATYAREAEAPSGVTQEEADKLAALGYLGALRDDTSADLPDPKDRIGDLEQMRAAAREEEGGRIAAAIRIYRTILEANPRFTDAWIRLAAIQEKEGDVESAEESYRRAITTSPSLASGLALSLGNLQLRAGKLDEAAEHAALALHKPTTTAGAHLLLARIALLRGDLEAAERQATAAAREESRRREATILIARARVQQGRLGEAMQLLEQMRRQSSEPLLDLEATRADVLARMNRPDEAESAFREEIARFPENRDAFSRLAILYVALGNSAAAEATLERMYLANRSPSTARLAAETWAAVEDERRAATWRRRAAAPQNF